MGKKLVSVWIETSKIEKIKQTKPISEFIREAINDALQPARKAYAMHSDCSLSMFVFNSQNNISFNYDDYVSIFSSLDSHYSCHNEPNFITDKETIIFAAITAKVLGTRYYHLWDISKSPHYDFDYASHFIVLGNMLITSKQLQYAQIHSGGFVQYADYLINGLKVQRFAVIGLIRILEVFLRDDGLYEDKQELTGLCALLDTILLKLVNEILEKSANNGGNNYNRMIMEEPNK